MQFCRARTFIKMRENEEKANIAVPFLFLKICWIYFIISQYARRSVWCTLSYAEHINVFFFGFLVHNKNRFMSKIDFFKEIASPKISLFKLPFLLYMHTHTCFNLVYSKWIISMISNSISIFMKWKNQTGTIHLMLHPSIWTTKSEFLMNSTTNIYLNSWQWFYKRQGVNFTYNHFLN